MLTRDDLKEIRKIEIVTQRLVNDQLAGSYHSVFKGRGMSFDEVRLYQPGDDIRRIDWNVSARTNDVYIKQFVEERELTVMILVDMSSSLNFGTRGETKQKLAAKLAALLAFSAIKNNDRVGLVLFTDEIEKYIPPKKGRKHVLRLITEIIGFEPQSRGTDLKVGLEFLLRVMKRKAVSFFISDFVAEDYERALRIAAKRHDLIPVVLSDPMEHELPNMGMAWFDDPETNEVIAVPTHLKGVRHSFATRAKNRHQEREALFRRLSLDRIRLVTGEKMAKPLMAFFKMRARRGR